ncbi:AbrB/MazE/SpoVT family DNA-binding domain-containing protein [Candidatus Woesearchaeota archaeon]|nr:AbrB/MazE/SpoVT family DNA-binding domain-containing protein [Candidatus Woesearchaeota archaeon]
MKKYPKSIKCDERGQLVIPRDIRSDLNIGEGTGFLLYTITKEGVLLKKIDPAPLDMHHEILNEIEAKSDKLAIKKENLKKAIKEYEKVKEGNLELI